ncbi:MAG TPA: MATE family efflux transporter, partial [Arsenophonus apicola]
ISATDMAAVAGGTSIWLLVILFGHGLLRAFTLVSVHLNGAGRRDRIAHQIRHGFWLTLVIMVLLYHGHLVIDHLHSVEPCAGREGDRILTLSALGRAGLSVLSVLSVLCSLFFQIAALSARGPFPHQTGHGGRLPQSE